MNGHSVSCAARLQVAAVLSEVSGVSELAIIVAIVVGALVAFGPVCSALGSLVAEGHGGALFNPVHNLACIAAGKGGIGLHVLRAVSRMRPSTAA